MLTPSTIASVRESFALIAPKGDELAELFYERLFTRQPMLRAVLPRDHWMRSRDLLGGLGTLVKNLHRLNAIEHVLMEFGLKGQRAGIMPQQYGIARIEMLAAMQEILGDQWSVELEADWTEALNTVTSVVLLGAARARSKAA